VVRRPLVTAVSTAFAALLALVSAGCGTSGSSASSASSAATRPVTLRLGYFPNITHAAALVGVQEHLFTKALGPRVTLETKTFNAGPDAVEAMLSGAIDATYIGPSPTITLFARSHGQAIRIVAGATSGGAAFVVGPDIGSALDLKGKTVASPQVGNTQDVALRTWLAKNALHTTTSGGGDVAISPQANADALNAFKTKHIAGAWVPEPWASRLVLEGGGKVLVDERDEWPDGKFVTAHLIVRTDFLRSNPDVVRRLLQGHIEATNEVAAGAPATKAAANAQLEALTGKALNGQVLDAAWKNLVFTVDPIASSLRASAAHAETLKLLEHTDLSGIYDLSLLNQLLRASNTTEVKA
jgi:NitT/TauT family transport system substrate-binding protein